LTFAENDFIEMAQELALRGGTKTETILNEQHGRITNPDRKARFTFVMPALSADASTRDTFFSSLAREENRQQERWVSDGLRFINHPLRRPYSERYIRTSLEMLSDIQRTGDIFFPLDWTGAVLGGHNSSAAAQTVTAFLSSQKDYPPRLRRVIEQNADALIRAANLLSK
jgi:aminopeptidase N